MNLKKSFKLSVYAIIFSFAAQVQAQVTIGLDTKPADGALLDLKQYESTNENQTASKGILYPRVKLTDRYELYPMYNPADAHYIYDKINLKKLHAGLVVFNVAAGAYFLQGLYVWNGVEWRKVDDSPASEASVSDLLCVNASMSPAAYSAGVYFDAIVKIPYTGGSGGSYDGTPKEGGTAATNNLYIERIGGKLNYGGGEVMYRISGTPLASSPATTTFPISFSGKNCNITVGSGTTAINTRNLKSDVLVDADFVPGQEATAKELIFDEITITEAGSYAFSVRLYGYINTSVNARYPFYIFLQKNNKSTVVDAAEIDLVTVEHSGVYENYTDYSYSVTLGGAYEVGDKVIISIQRAPTHPKGIATWLLKAPPTGDPLSPVRTSLIYWKL